MNITIIDGVPKVQQTRQKPKKKKEQHEAFLCYTLYKHTYYNNIIFHALAQRAFHCHTESKIKDSLLVSNSTLIVVDNFLQPASNL